MPRRRSTRSPGAQVETARAQLGVVETQIQAARITAPISGVVVARRSFSQGEVVQPGAVDPPRSTT